MSQVRANGINIEYEEKGSFHLRHCALAPFFNPVPDQYCGPSWRSRYPPICRLRDCGWQNPAH